MIIRKLCAIGISCHRSALFALLVIPLGVASPMRTAMAQEDSEPSAASSEPGAASSEPAAASSEPGAASKEIEVPEPIDSEKATVNYPRAVAIDAGKLLVVDRFLPGVWIQDGEGFKVFTPGTPLLRKPMNAPWCVTPHPDGGILIGDSATREIYHAKQPGAKLVALNNGYLGIPMAIVVGDGGKTIYVGDAERRAVFRLPIAGGKPELVARVNARGLSLDDEGNLWAVTPDAEAIQKIDVEKKTAETVVGDRPYAFPNGLVWTGDGGFVTDGYGKAIWRFGADGTTEKWFEGDPLGGPVGITADDQYLYVADPQKKQVYRFDRETKAVEPVL